MVDICSYVMSQKPFQPLTTEMLYIIQCRDYDEPYPKHVLKRLRRYERHLIELVANRKMNGSNILNHEFIKNDIIAFDGSYSEINEYEYLLALKELCKYYRIVRTMMSEYINAHPPNMLLFPPGEPIVKNN